MSKPKPNHTLKIFPANLDGLGQKQHSLSQEMRESKATVFTIQDTNHKRKGKYKNEEFHIFEAIKKKEDQC